MTAIDKLQKRRVATTSMRSFVAFSPLFALTSPKIGTNACENAPSAKRRLNRFGIRKATLKASVISEAPNALAIRVSLTSPKTRDSMVMLLTLAAADSRFTYSVSLI